MFGLTGGIASGKSTVSERLVKLGAFVADADIEARAVTDEPRVLFALKERFGPGVLCGDGRLDRAALAKAAFASPEGTRDLNAIVHPAVCRRLLRKACEAERSGLYPAVFIDVPLLVESGLYVYCRGVWLVTAALETRIARAAERDGSTREEALLRISRQASDGERAKHATRIIPNDGSLAELNARVDEAFALEFGAYARGLRREGI